MNAHLTDRLVCPRCGLDFGLVLLAERVEERRVVDGVLGCANCRERYPVREGVADLRPPPRPALEAASPAALGREPPDREDVVALAALLGIVEGPAWVALLGSAASLASGLAGVVEGLEVVAVETRAVATTPGPGVSVLAARPGCLPFRSGNLRGVALGRGAAPEGVDEALDEALRIVAPGGRAVVCGATASTRGSLTERGMEILLDDGGVVVARSPVPSRGRSSSGVPLPVVPASEPDNS